MCWKGYFYANMQYDMRTYLRAPRNTNKMSGEVEAQGVELGTRTWSAVNADRNTGYCLLPEMATLQ